MCNTTLGTRRIHEGLSRTSDDCKSRGPPPHPLLRSRNSGGANTCKGGQCEAYVKCYCSRRGKYPPETSCWRPSTKLVTPDGKCNNRIPNGTAVAAFQIQYYGINITKYYGHAGAFMGCEGSYTIKLYDQYCARGTGLSKYPSSHKYYNKYYVISTGCSEPSNVRCRNETPGGTACSS